MGGAITTVLGHRYTVNVTWGDCDAAGIVFYPRYYAMFDAGTHHMLSAAGIDHRHLTTRYGIIGLILVHTWADFLGSATYGDVLEVESRVAELGRSRVLVAHQILLGDEVITRGEEVRVWAGVPPDDPRGMESRPIPDAVREILLGQ